MNTAEYALASARSPASTYNKPVTMRSSSLTKPIPDSSSTTSEVKPDAIACDGTQNISLGPGGKRFAILCGAAVSFGIGTPRTVGTSGRSVARPRAQAAASRGIGWRRGLRGWVDSGAQRYKFWTRVQDIRRPPAGQWGSSAYSARE